MKKRCEYRHDWKATVEKSQITAYYCGACDYRPKPESKDWKQAESIIHLRSMVSPGDTVYTVLRHVSQSGMTRGIDVYVLGMEKRGDREVPVPIWITGYVGHAIGDPQPLDYWEKSRGLKIGGCGMDMGFHVVYSLSRVLFPEGHDGKDGGYALKHAWI